MSRIEFPFVAKDVSALAKSLNRSLHKTLQENGHGPSHAQLLNMLVQSVGYKNFQHFRAQHEAQAQLASPPQAPAPVDHLLVARVARHFDAAGSLMRWPGKATHRRLCLWVFWSRIPAGSVLSEAALNALLTAHHLFGDHALLRRELFDHAMVTRTPDGREYRRLERRPPPEAVALIRHVTARRAG